MKTAALFTLGMVYRPEAVLAPTVLPLNENFQSINEQKKGTQSTQFN